MARLAGRVALTRPHEFCKMLPELPCPSLVRAPFKNKGTSLCRHRESSVILKRSLKVTELVSAPVPRV